MGRKKRLKREQSAQLERATRTRRIALLATGAVVVLGVAAVIIATVASREAPVATASAAPAGSAEELSKAAAAIGFRPTPAEGIGLVEMMAAEATLPAPSPGLLPVGFKAPDFALLTPLGETVRLSDYRGKTVLLEFFATWCPHCQAEAPHLVRIAASLPASDFAVLGVNTNSEDAASIEAYDRYYGIPYPTLLDPGGRPGSFAEAGSPGHVTLAYRIAIYPTFYVIDPKGRIAWRSDREQPDALLLRELRNASGS